jgi:hypothetical protein
MEIIAQHELYEVASLILKGAHSDRKFAPDIGGNASVHLNILEVGGRAGKQYHKKK